MLDYALPLMMLAVFMNIRLWHRCILSTAFLSISLLCTSSISEEMTISSFLLYSSFELMFIALCYAVKTNDLIVLYLIRISILSMINQIFGAFSWFCYSELNLYYLFAEMVFILQIAGLFYGGLGRSYTASNFNPISGVQYLRRHQVS